MRILEDPKTKEQFARAALGNMLTASASNKVDHRPRDMGIVFFVATIAAI